MALNEKTQQCLQIIGEAINLEADTFRDHESWKFLGLTGLLASATAADIRSQIGLEIGDDTFAKYPTVGAFKDLLKGNAAGIELSPPPGTVAAEDNANPWEGIPKPRIALSVVLQGRLETSSKIVFLFPDGSGAGAAYGALPEIGSDVCLVGLNSPFLRQAQHFTCSVERMAKLWLDEVRQLQPRGRPYILGGWSAGGFYAFEMAKLLIAAGQRVEKLVLIDSPCRWQFEALPTQVVDELTRKGLMGASGDRKAPDWLVQHFSSTVISVEKYWPSPMPRSHVPEKVHFIWVKEGLVKSVPDSGLDVDMNVRVTRFLLEPRGDLKSEGWEKLLPGAQYTFDYTTGNHFSITQPPHTETLANTLRKVVLS